MLSSGFRIQGFKVPNSGFRFKVGVDERLRFRVGVDNASPVD